MRINVEDKSGLFFTNQIRFDEYFEKWKKKNTMKNFHRR